MPEDLVAAITRPRAKSNVRRGLWISAAVLLGLWILFETVPRFVRIPGLTPEALDPVAFQMAQARIGAHPYLAYAAKSDYDWRSPTETIHHNSLGFRGPETTWEKPAGVYRILCIGGSSTYGIGPSSNETNWPARLQFHLNERGLPKEVEVINGGCQGYSTFEMLTQLSLRGLDFRPDLVIVYETINDMRCALYPGVNHDNTHWRAVWPVERKLPLEAALESSLTYLAWRRYATGWWEERQNLGAWAIVDFGKWFKSTGDDYAQPTDPNLGFANFRRNLVSIVAVARAHGAEVLLSTQAMRVGDFETAAKSGAAQRAGFERMTKILGEVANERGVPYCDARAALEAEADRQRAETGLDRIFVRPDKRNGEVHMTDEGCDLLARTFAARIVELGLLK